jgi:hypothetical protein
MHVAEYGNYSVVNVIFGKQRHKKFSNVTFMSTDKNDGMDYKLCVKTKLVIRIDQFLYKTILSIYLR